MMTLMVRTPSELCIFFVSELEASEFCLKIKVKIFQNELKFEYKNSQFPCLDFILIFITVAFCFDEIFSLFHSQVE
jgi:hypothetical protein